MYKKTFIIFFVLTIIFTLLMAAGCSYKGDELPSGENTPSGELSSGNDNLNDNLHTHTYSSQWSNDGEYHWYAATCSHDVVDSKAKHDFKNGVCSVCKYCDTYGLIYQLNSDDTYTVAGIQENYSGTALFIPSKYNGKDVTAIAARAFEDHSELISVTIPDSINTIGAFAFDGCKGLTGVYISDMTSWCNINFKSSQSNPLEHAQKLYLNNMLVTRLNIPKDVEFLDSYAFYNCNDIIEITVDENNVRYKSQDNCVIDKTTGTLTLGCVNSIIPSYVKMIGPSAFSGCKGLTSIEIPLGVQTIGYYAFEDCSNLTEITLPSSVTSIRDGAFKNCTNLKNINLPGNLIKIGMKAFAYCTSLTSLQIPAGTQTIDQGAFASCTGLTQINIPSSVYEMGALAFVNCPALTIYCEDTTQPIGWDKTWMGSSNVVWNNQNI